MTHLKFRAALLAILFLAMIAFPWVNGSFAVWPDLASAENRALADAPSLAVDSLDSFPKLYDRYYTDHFPMRFRAINLFAHLQYHAFNTSPIPERALIGRDGWLFMEGNEQNAYTGKFRFSPDELESLKQELEYRNDYIAKRGGKFYFMIVPSKNVVYADKMPLSVHPSSPKSWGELINDHLRSNSNVRVIDMYPTMRAHSSNEMLYFKLDNHWNERGAFYTAQEMLRDAGRLPDAHATPCDRLCSQKQHCTDWQYQSDVWIGSRSRGLHDRDASARRVPCAGGPQSPLSQRKRLPLSKGI
jgi:alginate O-acetyltransferase complex protein AlgJ